MCACYLLGACNDVPDLLREATNTGVVTEEYAKLILAQHHFIAAFSPALRASHMRRRRHLDYLCTGISAANSAETETEPEIAGGIEGLAWRTEMHWDSDLFSKIFSFALNPSFVPDSKRPSREHLLVALNALQSVLVEIRDDFLPLQACCFFHMADYRQAKLAIGAWKHKNGEELLRNALLAPQLLSFEVACDEAMKDHVAARKTLENGLRRLWDIEECRRRTEPLWQKLARMRYQEKDFAGAIEALERASSI